MSYEASEGERALSEDVREIWMSLGPGYRESVYQRALASELRRGGKSVQLEVAVPIHYAGDFVGYGLADLIVNKAAVIEIKTVQSANDGHFHQVRGYLRALDYKYGYLANFGWSNATLYRVFLGGRAEAIRGS